MAINLKEELTKIANSIRTKTGETNTIKPSQFVDKINLISTGLNIDGDLKTYTVETDNNIKEGMFVEITENNTVKPYETLISGVSKTSGTETVDIYVPWTPCFQLEYTDTSNVSYDERFTTENELMTFISTNKTNIKTAKLSSRGGIKITSCYNLFNGCSNLISLDLSDFDTSQVTNMSIMFGDCSSLTSLDLSSFDTSKVTNMGVMFYNCSSLTSLDLSNFNTSQVTNMFSMFGNCWSLTSLDVSSFDTSKVTNMSGMFGACESLTSLDLSNFDTSKVTNMNGMLTDCQLLTSLDLSNFDTSKVTNIGGMFSYCSSLITIYCNDDWNTNTITFSRSMFASCSKLVGAVPYDSSKTDITMANPDTGYFTKKV